MSEPTRHFPQATTAYARLRIARLLDLATLGATREEDFEGARLALEALPLGTGDFGTASNRLANARAYLETGEWGAACFELRLLLRGLES
jgi:hypothetical protein